MKISIDEKMTVLMKKEARSIFNRNLILLMFLDVFAIFINITGHSETNIVLLIVLFLLLLIVLFMIYKNCKRVDEYLNSFHKCVNEVIVINNDNGIIINNITKDKTIEITKKEIKSIRTKKTTAVIFLKNREFLIIPYIDEQKTNKKINILLIFVILVIVIFAVIRANIGLKELNNTFNINDKKDEIAQNLDKFMLENNGAEFVSVTIMNNGGNMTDLWHTNQYSSSKYNDVTNSWCLPNDNYIFFSNTNNGYTKVKPLEIRDTQEFKKYKQGSETFMGDIIYFSKKGENNMIYEAIIEKFSDGKIRCVRGKNDSSWEEFYLNETILEDFDITIIQLAH